MLVCGIPLLPTFREMYGPNRCRPRHVAVDQSARQQSFEPSRRSSNLIQKLINHTAQDALRKAFRRGIDRRDAPEVNRDFFIVLDNLEFRMIHANSLSAQSRLAKDNNALTGRDHFLHIMQIEPSTHQRLAQSVCVRLLQRGFKDFFPSAESAQRSFNHLATKAHGNIPFLARKARELTAIFVASRKMSK